MAGSSSPAGLSLRLKLNTRAHALIAGEACGPRVSGVDFSVITVIMARLDKIKNAYCPNGFRGVHRVHMGQM